MKRWNGWGDDTISHPLPDIAQEFLTDLVGSATPTTQASFEDVIATVPPSRLASHPLISDDPVQRVRHARGQSLPDWVALRSGQINIFPDAIAYPTTVEQVRELIQYATQTDTRLIPYGGGTSVVGHINPLPGDKPVLTVNLSRLNALHHFNQDSHLATFGAGITGPDLEAQLRAKGFTLGHFPQSFEYSTLGGWVVTRSCGQQSLGFGRIEDLFVSGKLEAPVGSLELPSFPASAAGPDLREVVLGSEGRLGILTEATVRITPLPEREDFHAIFFPNWEQAESAVKQIIQAHLPLSMMRLSTATETETTLILAGHRRLIGAMEKALSVWKVGDNKCMLLIGFSGREAVVKTSRKEALSITGKHGGVHIGTTFGKQWHKNRFRSPYLRNNLWEMGYAVDTLETATTWDKVPSLIKAIETALHKASTDNNERIHVFTHLSHLYAHGSSIYTTYLFRLKPDPAQTLEHWHHLKSAASQAIVDHTATISHQHGVGTDHLPYLLAEKGNLGISTIQNILTHFDPNGLMNPGKLISK